MAVPLGLDLLVPVLILFATLAVALIGLKMKIPLITLISSLFSLVIYLGIVLDPSGAGYFSFLLFVPLVNFVLLIYMVRG